MGRLSGGRRSPEDWIEARLRRTRGALGGDRFSRLPNTIALAALARHERRIPFRPLAEIEELQRTRLSATMRHAYATVPFYRRALDEQGLRPEDFRTADDLCRLPFLEGVDLVEDPMRFVALPFRRQGREVFKTSGSTSGLRKPIFWDHASLLLRAARGERDRVVIVRLSGERRREAMAREFVTNERHHLLARLMGIDLVDHQRLLILPADFSARTQRTIYSEHSAVPRRPIHYHHLPPTAPLEVVAAQIAAIRPRVVFSFGSFADQFFRFLDAHGAPSRLPRLWVYLGDRISSEGRELAERKGCAVYSVYGAMEAGTIGFQCEERNGFHLNIDLCPVRVIDPEGRDVAPGEPGEVVISPLDNRAMALFNYRLGDRGVLSPDPCPCGRSLPLLARLEGRHSEIVRLADGRELSSLTIEALFAPELRRTIKAQIEQESPGHLRWRVVPQRDADPDELRKALLARARLVLGTNTSLAVDLVRGHSVHGCRQVRTGRRFGFVADECSRCGTLTPGRHRTRLATGTESAPSGQSLRVTRCGARTPIQ